MSCFYSYTGEEHWDRAVGKTIAACEVDEDNNLLRIQFDNGDILRIYDDGQSCCESRWIHTDDDLAYHVGAQLLNAELVDGPDPDQAGHEVLDVQFLQITTSKGVFTVVNYNSHNGYYGGFSLRADYLNSKQGLY